jgi:hypothetical protein
LALSPERVNPWVNLGQACAKQGQHKIAVACLANGYRFSKNTTATRQFLQKLADDEDEDAAVAKEPAERSNCHWCRRKRLAGRLWRCPYLTGHKLRPSRLLTFYPVFRGARSVARSILT